jgi:hypothetical protein
LQVRAHDGDGIQSATYLESILRIRNLQLQRQRCSRLERFYIREKILLFEKRALILVAL